MRISRSFSRASAISVATSAAGRLKLSTLKAYTLTVVTPRSRHHSSASTSCRAARLVRLSALPVLKPALQSLAQFGWEPPKLTRQEVQTCLTAPHLVEAVGVSRSTILTPALSKASVAVHDECNVPRHGPIA